VSLHRLPPALLLVASFATAIGAGAVLLALPLAARGPALSPLEALFTATSAVCVTGLTVVDTGSRLSGFGQGVVLALVQAGGLGIMTFAVFVTLALGGRLSFQDRMVIQDSLLHSPDAGVRRLVRYILGFTLAAEGIGAVLLTLRFARELPLGEAAYVGAFHAISAFCNAGFSLYPDSLIRYRGDLVVNVVVAALVILGGLGFLVSDDVRQRLSGRRRTVRRPLSLQSRLALSVTASLLATGALAMLVFEWNNLLRGLPLGERLLAAWFQAVTPRTAGFNTLDYGNATSATLVTTIFLMFVGASPGSTGGGIKTTTLALLGALFVARWRGRGRATVFHRTVPHAVMDRALTLWLVSAWVVALAVLGLLLSEHGLAPYAQSQPRFLPLLFEAVSAFGTVGLSTGLTPRLTSAGQLLIVALMFVGRVGPLTVALAVGGRRGAGRFRYAEENVMVG